MLFFTRLEKTIQEYIWNHKRLHISKGDIILRRINIAGGITIPDLKLYYSIIVTVCAHFMLFWYWLKCRQIDQWNRTNDPEIYLQMI